MSQIARDIDRSEIARIDRRKILTGRDRATRDFPRREIKTARAASFLARESSLRSIACFPFSLSARSLFLSLLALFLSFRYLGLTLLCLHRVFLSFLSADSLLRAMSTYAESFLSLKLTRNAGKVNKILRGPAYFRLRAYNAFVYVDAV